MSKRKNILRPPEQIKADRAAIIAACNGDRSSRELARILDRYPSEVAADIVAIRKTGHVLRIPVAHPSMRNRACVYRHFDAEGRLLYVGACSDPVRRLASHASASGWYRQIARIEIEHFDNGEDAIRAEREAIIAERPLHNVRLSLPMAAE